MYDEFVRRFDEWLVIVYIFVTINVVNSFAVHNMTSRKQLTNDEIVSLLLEEENFSEGAENLSDEEASENENDDNLEVDDVENDCQDESSDGDSGNADTSIITLEKGNIRSRSRIW